LIYEEKLFKTSLLEFKEKYLPERPGAGGPVITVESYVAYNFALNIYFSLFEFDVKSLNWLFMNQSEK
jgi:hypothetical protein